VDERGRLLVISAEELDALAAHIEQRGRMSVAELTAAANQLLDLSERQTAARVREAE
jgi:hypothetical protein